MGFVLYTTYSREQCLHRLRQKADMGNPLNPLTGLRMGQNKKVMGWTLGSYMQIYLSRSTYAFVRASGTIDARIISDPEKGGTWVKERFFAVPLFACWFVGIATFCAWLDISFDHFLGGNSFEWDAFVGVPIFSSIVILVFSVIEKIAGTFLRRDREALLAFLKTILDTSDMPDHRIIGHRK